jgi:hypothetical protein
VCLMDQTVQWVVAIQGELALLCRGHGALRALLTGGLSI